MAAWRGFASLLEENFAIDVLGRVLFIRKPIIRLDEVLDTGDFFIQGMIVCPMLVTMNGAKCFQRLKIKELVVEDVAALHACRSLSAA